MAFDQTTRNRLARFVSDARALLTEEFTRQLQHVYGLDPTSGEVTELARLTALDDTRRETARILRETLEYYLASASPAAGERAEVRATLERILREQAFTVLNRLCALRMAEARGIILEAVAQGYQSKGFQLYAHLAGSALGEKGNAYRSFLFGLFDELAVELPPLFDRFSPQGRLFPREPALLKLLDLLNAPDLETLWAEDETIGWIYQYFNSKEERQAMRAESQAPRNSRELAVRNQFFTPRYVVEFLTDNTLGRIWYEMTKGETALKETCRYLVRRPREVFLGSFPVNYDDAADWVRAAMGCDFSDLPEHPQLHDIGYLGILLDGYKVSEQFGYGDVLEFASRWMKGYIERGEPFPQDALELWLILFAYQRGYLRDARYEPEEEDPILQAIRVVYDALRQALQNPPQDLSQEELLRQPAFIAQRPTKDPREIRMLDPACGSMHFGLYAFDLFEIIYREAWERGLVPPEDFDYIASLRKGIFTEKSGEEMVRSTGCFRFEEIPAMSREQAYENYCRQIPRLIIEHNIHGIDIDPRAVQIAGLSLWLRAQKSWQAQGLKPTERPQIRKSNIVCAEPMPGDRQMLEEFLSELQADKLEGLMRRALEIPAGQKVRATPAMAEALAKLVRTVWQEMELAGEAGSLLKIEETLRDAITMARKQTEEKAPLFRVLEFGLNEPVKEQYLPVLAGEEQDFWNQAEALVLAALREYSEQAANGQNFRRRLFAGDAGQGFALIDLCRKSYDAILMNPPFGIFSRQSQNYSRNNYPYTYNDIFASFIDRFLDKLQPFGTLGAITSRNGFFLGSFENWRTKVVMKKAKLQVVSDLGDNVMDDAMVEAAAYCFQKSKNEFHPYTLFVRLLSINDRETALHDEIQTFNKGNVGSHLFIRDISDFRILRLSPFAYWVQKRIITSFSQAGTLEPDVAVVRCGLSTGNNDRFIRVFWEIPNAQISNRWFPLVMTGTSQPWYSPLMVTVDWYRNGYYLSSFPGSTLRSTELYFKPGMSWTRRAVRFIPYAIPAGCIPSASRYMAFPRKGYERRMLGIAGSNIAGSYLRFFGEKFNFPNYLVDSVKSLPWIDLNETLGKKLDAYVTEQLNHRRKAYQNYEPFHEFVVPKLISKSLGQKSYNLSFDYNHLLTMDLDQEIANEFGFSERDVIEIESDMIEAISVRNQSVIEADSEDQESDPLGTVSEKDEFHNLLSYLKGSAFGRWDIRYATGEKPVPELPDPFAPLPACPPGMLQNAQGLPAAVQDVPADYPLRITWGGVLVDDPGHSEDVGGRAREALQVIWGERAEAIEQEACQILGVGALREYFQKPGLFFADHLKRYSKSRRAAPIYWPLSTPSCSYTLWLYYHRLSDQTLFTCVIEFVDPKLKQVSEEAARLRLKKGRSSTDEKELERLTDFERELKDFRSELLRVAAFWKPDLNDGVEITAAPLWKLFQHKPWQKRLKETWQKLEAGDYDWAHLAYSIWPERVREKCKTDKSLAIAHGLEELYVEPKTSAQKKAGRKKKEEPKMEGFFDDREYS